MTDCPSADSVTEAGRAKIFFYNQMLARAISKTKCEDPRQDEGGLAAVDTSVIFEQLVHKYKARTRPIEVDFRELVQWVRVGDQQTHLLHPYPAKLLPHIAHFFVRATTLVKPKTVVLDPFCGSGTVALETSLAGCTPYVADANPMALLIARVKTTPYAPDELKSYAANILASARRLRTAPAVEIVNEHLWYAPEKKTRLEILLRAIRENAPEHLLDFFLVCFSVLARKISYADPRISVPVRLRDKEAYSDSVRDRILERLAWLDSVDPLSEYSKICEWNIERVEVANTTNPKRKTALVVGSDARKLRSPDETLSKQLPAGSVPFIITSPPYGSAQKYIRATSLSLNWLGMASPAKLKMLEAQSIGREHLPGTSEIAYEDLTSDLRSQIRRIEKANPLRARITFTYLQEMRSTLTELARVCARGGRIALIVGNNQVAGQLVRNDKYFTEFLIEQGLELELSMLDDIKSRGLMTKRNRTASVISRESVLVFYKK